MIYDFIIIGAGASGLFAGASLPSSSKGLILEKTNSPGKKLLMAGSGQCNLTHGGSIKDFLEHYGGHRKEVRNILYQFNNMAVIEFFQSHGLPCFEREDGKVFPKSLNGKEVLQVLLNCCKKNNVTILCNNPVTGFSPSEEGFRVDCSGTIYNTKKLVVSTGGCSYPTTGSDGQFFSLLEDMGLPLVDRKPALVPIHVYDYPYKELTGIAFKNVNISLKNIHQTFGDLLFTHDCFSGPAILSISRYALQNQVLVINYLPNMDYHTLLTDLKKGIQGNTKQVPTFFNEFFNQRFPKRFWETLCQRLSLDITAKASQLSGTNLKDFLNLLTGDEFSISGLGGYSSAMVTCGGVSLAEVNLKTLSSKSNPNLYFIGEVLDVDGDTGGYNLQFAFSSGYLVGKSL